MPNKVKGKEEQNIGITPADVKSCITRIKVNKNAVNTTTVLRYDEKGQSDQKLKDKLTDEQTCATKITSGRKVSYKIKTQRGGRFYNPSKDAMNYGLTKRDRSTNDAMFNLQNVSLKAFDAYVKFLQTRYETYLISAEREI